MPISGRQVAIGFAKETVRGTWVTPAYWVPVTSIDYDDKYEIIENNASFGVLNDVTGAAKAKQWSEGEITGPIGHSSIGLLLKALLGSEAAPSLVETGVYDHVFTLATSAQHPSLSVTKSDSVRTFGFTNAMITSIEISCELESFATVTVSLRGKAGVSQSASATYSTEYLFHRTGITLVRATTLAGLSSGTAVPIKNMKLTFTPVVIDDDVMGDDDPSDFLNASMRIEGEFEILYDADTFHDFVKNQTATYYLLKLLNSTTIGASSNPTLSIELAGVVSKDWNRKDELDNIVSQKIKIVGKYNTTDALAVRATLRNAVSAAY